MPMTMRWPRASLRPSSANCSSAVASRPTPRRRWQSSSLSRASTICAVGTLPSAICHRPTSSAATRQAHLARAHPSLPSCSRPSRRGLKASEHKETSERRPSLTGAARDGQYDVRAGTKERAPQGPNKRTGPKRRQDAVRSCSLNPNRHLSTKPGQAHATIASAGFELLAGFLLGKDGAGTIDGFGAGLGGEEGLELQGLLDVERGELVARLGGLEGTHRALGTG